MVRRSPGRTRLAPSPTGALHLGHARTFLWTWWLARRQQQEILLRMEDLDPGRARSDAIQQAYDDLTWLGMDWDFGPPESRPLSTHPALGPLVQSQRLDSYAQVLQRLERLGRIYPCSCTRASIAAAVGAVASAPHESDPQSRYPGICRGRYATMDAARAAGATQLCWRFAVPDSPVDFVDQLAGPQHFDVAATCGDFPLTRFDGAPAYQLACVADDAAMGITHVVRGDDLLSSTPRQILLYQALGWEPPAFAHAPLVIGSDGKRLAKRHGESRIASFRAAGCSAQRLVGWVAWRSGQIDRPREISAQEVLVFFDPDRLPRQRLILSDDDLRWLVPNSRQINRMAPAEAGVFKPTDVVFAPSCLIVF